MSDGKSEDVIDVYWSFRSPYSYLATGRLRALAKRWPLTVRPRVVYPIAIRTPEFFREAKPQWAPYLLHDITRVAASLGVTLTWPNPDPVVQDFETQAISDEQPHIHRLSRLGVLAAEEDPAKGLAFLDEASTLIWSGEPWLEDGGLADAASRAGLDLAAMDARAEAEADRLTAQIETHQSELGRHHWGVPTMVFRDEPFYGQDRIALLEWRLEQVGLRPVA
ncbi:MAG: DsbA family protein [Pseudomonadota bacterium]